MGFKTNAYAKVWEIRPDSDTSTTLKISISYKDKNKDEYVVDFSGFVNCVTTATAKKAANLKPGDTIKLGDVDVKRIYNKESGKVYETFKIFSFDVMDKTKTTAPKTDDPVQSAISAVDDGEPDERLPF